MAEYIIEGEMTKLIILHPNHYAQHPLMWQYIEDHPASVYVRFTGAYLQLNDIRQQFDEAVRMQLSNIGYWQSPSIVLDECDRTDPADFGQFLQELLEKAPDTQIVIAGRIIPPAIMSTDALREVATIVPNMNELLQASATAQARGVRVLNVQAFGNGHVSLDNVLVNNWDGMLPRALFFYLIDKGMVTRDDIFATFWPTMKTREATNVFHVTKRKISEVLGMDLTTYSAGFYRIASDIELNYDVMNFTHLIQQSMIVDEKESIPLLERALKLMRGRFLNSLDLDWVTHRRDELLIANSDAMVALADARRNLGQVNEALGLYLRASSNNPHREDIVLNIMQLYEQREQYHDALQAYDRLYRTLQDNLGLEPSEALMRLANSLRRSVY